jgi:hypothetical protein
MSQQTFAFVLVKSASQTNGPYTAIPFDVSNVVFETDAKSDQKTGFMIPIKYMHRNTKVPLLLQTPINPSPFQIDMAATLGYSINMSLETDSPKQKAFFKVIEDLDKASLQYFAHSMISPYIANKDAFVKENYKPMAYTSKAKTGIEESVVPNEDAVGNAALGSGITQSRYAYGNAFSSGTTEMKPYAPLLQVNIPRSKKDEIYKPNISIFDISGKPVHSHELAECQRPKIAMIFEVQGLCAGDKNGNSCKVPNRLHQLVWKNTDVNIPKNVSIFTDCMQL